MTKDELLELVRKDARMMTKGEKIRLVTLLSMPAMLAQVSSVVMQVIDASMLGHLSTAEAASVSLVSTTIWLFGGLLSAFASGFSVQVAHRVGARDYEGSRGVIRQGIVLCLAFSMILLSVGAGIAPFLPHWLGADAELWERSTEYFLIFACSMPVVILNGLFAGSLRCSGNIKTPSMLLIMLCFLDVIFNYIFIFILDMSTAGAAYGTLLSYVICLGGMAYALIVKDKKLRFGLDEVGRFRPTAKILRKALRIGAPIGMERGVMCTAQVAISSIIAPLGAVAIAANGFGITVESLCYMPGYGVAEAATTLVGQSKGAERRDLMHSFAWIAMAMGVGIMTLMGAVMWIFAPEMIGMITPDADVVALGTEILRIEAWCEPGFAAAIVAYSVFIGAGKTLVPSLMNLASIWGVRFTLTLLLAPTYGLHGVWMAMATELMVRGTIFTIRLCTKGWSYVRIRGERSVNSFLDMELIKDKEYGGERPLYAQKDLRLEGVTIHVGESSIKECSNIEAEKCTFEGKYVFWETKGFRVHDCYFAESARSSLWYSSDCKITSCRCDAPKLFRRMKGIYVADTDFPNGEQFLWDCDDIEMHNVSIANCDYVFMHSHNIKLENYRQDGNYGFQYARNVEIHNAVINSKDAFWEAENVTLVDCEVNGEYLGWYAKNMKLVRCHLTGEQLLCYVDGLVLEDCTFGEDANLLFEYSTVNGNIKGDVTSIKNPTSGTLRIDGKVGEMIIDENQKAPANAVVEHKD